MNIDDVISGAQFLLKLSVYRCVKVYSGTNFLWRVHRGYEDLRWNVVIIQVETYENILKMFIQLGSPVSHSNPSFFYFEDKSVMATSSIYHPDQLSQTISLCLNLQYLSSSVYLKIPRLQSFLSSDKGNFCIYKVSLYDENILFSI